MIISKILIIIQRSNGDVFLSSPLIKALYESYNHPKIDLLINDYTLAIAQTLNHIHKIYQFSYKKKKENPVMQEVNIIKNIYKKYDLSINLTASDRSVLYAILASKLSISAVEKNNKKSWWKKLFLSKYYTFYTDRHMIYNTLKPLELLGIEIKNYDYSPYLDINKINETLLKFNLKEENYIIFHPSAQYAFRSYPIKNINQLLELLRQLDIKIVLTGTQDEINQNISDSLTEHKNFLNLIGKTSLQELYALISKCKLHIGMDTLNTHIAASFNKKQIAIYGPNGVTQWSPFNSKLIYAPKFDTPPLTKYGNFTIIQSNMKCVPCNQNGCDGLGLSECLEQMEPKIIFNEVKNCLIK